MLRPTVERPHREHTPQTESRAALAFGVIFLAGYLPGIWLGRSGTTPLGQQLADYYTSRPEGTSLAAAFGAQLAVNFLQLILVLLCGFCVWGVGLLALLFAARGLLLLPPPLRSRGGLGRGSLFARKSTPYQPPPATQGEETSLMRGKPRIYVISSMALSPPWRNRRPRTPTVAPA